MLEHTRFGTRKTIHRQFDEVVESTKRALADQAFRIVSELDLGEDSRRCTMLGAWNSRASRAVREEPEVSGLLPCNVVIYEQDGKCVVSTVDPFCTLEVVGPDVLVEETVLDSREKLQRAIESV